MSLSRMKRHPLIQVEIVIVELVMSLNSRPKMSHHRAKALQGAYKPL